MSHIPIFCLILLIVEKRTNIWWAHYSFTYLDCMRLQSCVKYVGFKPHRQQWIVGRNLHWEAMKAFAWSVSHYMNGLKSYNPWTFMLHANALDVVFYLQVYHCLMFQMRQCVWYHAWEFPEQESYALQEFITFSTWKTSKTTQKWQCSTWLAVILDKLYWTHPFWLGHLIDCSKFGQQFFGN